MSFTAPVAIASHPRLGPLEDVAAPAFAVDGSGAIVWANAAGRSAAADGAFDPAGARAAGRIAKGGTGGLLRLRLGAGGRFGPLVLHAGPLDGVDGVALLLSPAIAVQPAPPMGVAPADVARTAPERPPASVAADPPPHPGSDLPTVAATPSADFEPPAPSEPVFDPPSGEDADAAVRFVFEIDAGGRIAFLSPDLATAVGYEAWGAIGRLWDDVAAELRLDPTDAVGRALRGRGGWSGLTIHWPTADGGRLALELSALPMFDRGRTFVGFRGFGVGVSAAVARVAADRSALRGPEAPSPTDAAPRADPVDAPPSAHDPDEDLFVEAVAASGVGRRPALSTDEESAFDEIARRLRDVGGDDSEAVRSPERAVWEDIAADAELSIGDVGPAEAAPEAAAERDAPERSAYAEFGPADEDMAAPAADPAPRPDGADLERLLDRLDVGAIVFKDGRALYANRAALGFAGCADLAELAACATDATPAQPGAASVAIEWGGADATLVTLAAAEPAGQAAMAREAELAAILDTATDGVLTLDGAGRILSLNRSAEALFGYEARDIVGSLFSLALAPESRRVAFDYLDGLKQNGVASLLNDGREVLGLVRQGGAIPLYLTLGRIGTGDEPRYCAVLRDITHWKKSEEELLAAKRQAERANAQKSDFLAKVSHEIRTPLNAIIGFAEVMIEERFGALGNERYRGYLKDIHMSGGHLISLVNDLLDLSRIEAGRLELEFVAVDLNEAVAQAVSLLQPQANRDRIIIRTSLARGLPPVLADRRSIRQIVVNLTANAVQFTQGGGQVIVATALTDLGQAVIRVRDTGAGMSRKELAHALEPFRQAPTTGGAGVGLPLTKALAEANQAAFNIESAPGEGTLAEVTFPVGRVMAG